jgi:hypothetical protein
MPEALVRLPYDTFRMRRRSPRLSWAGRPVVVHPSRLFGTVCGFPWAPSN